MKYRVQYNPARKCYRVQYKEWLFWHCCGHYKHYYSGSDWAILYFKTQKEAFEHMEKLVCLSVENKEFSRNNFWASI